jgi:chromosome segregation ATPase
VEPLLAFADELERRDADVASELARVEQLQAEVDQIRVHADALAEWLPWAAAAVGTLNVEELAAADEAARLAERLPETGDDLELARLRTAIADVEQRRVRAQENARALADEIAAREREGRRLEARATKLAPSIPDTAPPEPNGLPALRAWASQARGALLVERSGLARERESIVREASELLASVLGDPLAATSVAGLRERLARALA